MLSICLILVLGQPKTGQTESEMPEIIINEMAWAGSSASSSDEWIELYNTTDQPIDLAGWQITKDTSGTGSNETLMVTIPVTDDPELQTMHIIPAQNFFLVAHWDPTASALDVPPNYNATSLTLSNTKLVVRLYDGPYLTANLIDTAGNGKLPFYGANTPNSYTSTMERDTEYGPGDIKESWHEATTSVNLKYIDGATNLGTPKAENSIPPPPPPPAPIITSITPTETPAVDDFVLNQIDGNNFATSGNIQIKLQNGTQEIYATDWQILSPVLIINIKFDLIDAEAGDWDIIITNPDQQSATLINALDILELDDPIENDNNADIQISEIYPRPTTGANDEFIELYNAGESSANLKGWKLDDQYPGGSAIYTISDDIIINPYQYLAFSKTQTKISLNDSGDYARLLNPQEIEREATPNYGPANKGEAYAKFNGVWKWTLRPTPNAENLWDNPTPIDDEDDTDNDPDSLGADEINIQMDADDITSTSVLLNWQISLIGAIGGLKLYQSDDKNYLGEKIAQPNVTQTELIIENLQPNTIYYFTLVGSYNVDDIKSNQIKITTEKSGTGSAVLGDTSSYKQIIFTEILPNPASGEEYIELFNPTDEPINLSGWKLQDASGRTYVITAFDLRELTIADSTSTSEVLLEPNQYLLLKYPTTHIRLNNSGGEELQLMDADDNLIDEVYYDGTAKKGYAYVIAPNQKWFWSDEITPGAENNISFATIDEDSGYYLVDTGKTLPWQIILWISLMISGIMVSYRIYHEANN